VCRLNRVIDFDPDTLYQDPATVASCMLALTMVRKRSDLTVVEKLALAETTVDTAYQKGTWEHFRIRHPSSFSRDEGKTGRQNLP
jgi:hypothetical protein